ncbi:unnamed protein product [marine sediment metagenome]|uniref:Bacterial repeat domain-containing protein n=1 Tax=marine sediment metagenome TaxID=412755 RepID=X1V3H9_9ZZZZ
MSRYHFVEWRDELGNVWTTPAISLLIDRDKTLTVYYEEVPAPPTYTLTVATTAGGNTDPTPGSYTHPEGASVTVTAIPNNGYKFDHWIINGITRTENPTTVTMDKNYTLTAYFTALPPPEHVLTIATTIGGTTTPSPGTYPHVENTTATVTAVPDSGFNFDHWILDGATYTSNPINVLMDTDHSLTAYFSEEAPPPQYSI